MNRRSFIKIGIMLNLMVWLGLYFLDFKWTVRRMLKKDTERLGLGKNVIEKFLLEADRENFWSQFSVPKKAFISLQHNLSSWGLRLPYHDKYVQYRNVITGHFLLSTDLFTAPYTEGRKVKYTGFMNPYRTGCSNPFSNLRMTA